MHTVAIILALALNPTHPTQERPFLVVLGVAQDAGFPQAGCRKDCCKLAWTDHSRRRYVSSLGVVDPSTNQTWLIDCTPDFPDQLRQLRRRIQPSTRQPVSGIFLTHAHIGHYCGLIHLGREVMGARKVPVYAMLRMRQFLKTNGPWSQLVSLENIRLEPLEDSKTVKLGQIRITPLLVPHRDEFSETVGFTIQGPNRTALFLPDIDKWERWDRKIEDLLRTVDVAYLDGTFFADGEIPQRNISEIPHPFVVESIARFQQLPTTERSKVRFIHLNHTNPLLQSGSKAIDVVRQAGHRVAQQGERFDL